MGKILAFLSVFAVALCAAPRPTQDDFNACFEKNLPSFVKVGSSDGIALSTNLIVVPKGATPIKNYIKFDPFLGLYLVASDKKLEPIPMRDENATKKSDWISITHELNATNYGHVKAMGERLGELDTLTFDANGTGALLSPCCKLRGIAMGGDKFVPIRYLRHFLAHKDVYYGDVGARFEEAGGKFYVKSVEQLGRGRAFMAGDEILSINGEKFATLRELNERILFAGKDEILTFEVMRKDEVLKFAIGVFDSNLNAKKPQTQAQTPKKQTPKTPATTANEMKFYGLSFDENLVVRGVENGSNAANFGIKTGDKLIQIGQKVILSSKDAQSMLATNGAKTLLFRRNGFDFFFEVR